MRISRLAAALGALALALALAGCADSTEPAESAESPDDSASQSDRSSLSLTDPWVKAADSGMTAAFGTLVNDGEEDLVVVSAASEVATTMQLHETVEAEDGSMAMQPKADGFLVPAGGEHELAPGGDHLMMMELTRGLKPGESVSFTLTLDDGSTLDLTATVKAFDGAEEDYQKGGSDGMDMSDGQESEDS